MKVCLLLLVGIILLIPLYAFVKAGKTADRKMRKYWEGGWNHGIHERI